MIINHNMQSINAHRQMGVNATNSQKSMEKLSSGLRINRAGDDAAGLAISEKMRGQIRGLDQAGRNAQDGISMIQTAEGALQETHSILQRMRELGVQSSNDTNTVDDRAEIQKEIEALKEEIDRIGNDTEFNTQKLLNGDKSAATTVTTVTTVTTGVADPGTAGTITGTAGTLATNLSAALTSGDNELSITVDKTKYTLDDAALKAWDGNGDDAALKAFLEGASDGVGGTLADKATVSVTGGKVTITSNTTGTTSEVKVDVTGTEGAQITAATGLSNATNTGLATGGTKQAGEYEFTLGAGDLTIDGVTIAAADLQGDDAAIETVINGALNDGVAATDGKYTVGVLDGKLTLTQTAGNESATAPVISQASKDNSAAFQVGANANQTISIAINDMRSNSETLTATELKDAEGNILKDVDGNNLKMSVKDIDVKTKDGAQLATQVLDNAIKAVSAERSNLGAVQNRLEHTINNLGTSSENLTAAESRIRDVDMAKEMMTMSKNNILNQAAQAMLAQANQAPQQVLQLLR